MLNNRGRQSILISEPWAPTCPTPKLPLIRSLPCNWFVAQGFWGVEGVRGRWRMSHRLTAKQQHVDRREKTRNNYTAWVVLGGAGWHVGLVTGTSTKFTKGTSKCVTIHPAHTLYINTEISATIIKEHLFKPALCKSCRSIPRCISVLHGSLSQRDVRLLCVVNTGFDTYSQSFLLLSFYRSLWFPISLSQAFSSTMFFFIIMILHLMSSTWIMGI